MRILDSHVAESVSVNLTLTLAPVAGTCRLPRKSLPCSTGSSLRRLVLQVLLLGRRVSNSEPGLFDVKCLEESGGLDVEL